MSSRRYNSALREERAQETRKLIRRSARDLFAGNGFASTTIAAIAERAGVAPQTIYANFGSKGAIITSILEDMEADADQETWVTRILNEPNPHRQIRIFAGWIRTLFERATPILQAALSARSDPDVSKLIAQGDANRRAGTDQLASLLDTKGALRTELSPGQASEQLWLLTTPEQYLHATTGLAWTPEAYERWLGDLLDREILRP